ncbi:hypothetical protein BTS2_1366 [Bacillus sp. TS-2]|nr:hypothetical protein BTS2_1366 [Bacillus sp. TS-2]
MNTEPIRKSLSQLSKHSLNQEQKQRILFKIREQTKPPKRLNSYILYPVSLFIFSLTSFLLIVIIQSYSGSSENQASLNAPQASSFYNEELNQELYGIENEVGIIGHIPFVAEDKTRVAKILLYLWINQSITTESVLEIRATNASEEQVLLLEGEILPFSEGGSIITSFNSFPKEGLWQLDFYLENKELASFTTSVLPPFPTSENFQVITHPMETGVNETNEWFIESKQQEPNIEVDLYNHQNVLVSSYTFPLDHSVIESDTGENIYRYHYTLSLPKEDQYYFMINGEKTNVFSN